MLRIPRFLQAGSVERPNIALDMMLSQYKSIDIFLISPCNICCVYPLEVPQQGASNEYPQHMFSWRNKKNIYLIPTLILTYGPNHEDVQADLGLHWHMYEDMFPLTLWLIYRCSNIQGPAVQNLTKLLAKVALKFLS